VSDRNWRYQCPGVRREGDDHTSRSSRSEIHAIQANYNPLLDVARETYKENVGDIHTLHSALTEKHGLPMQLIYQKSAFLFAIKKGDLPEERLPCVV